MGHAGGQISHAGQLLAANDLLGPLANLTIEIVANFLEAGRHRVHGLGQLAHLIVRIEVNAVIEFSRGDFSRALHERGQRAGNPFAKQLHRGHEQQRGQCGGHPGEPDRPAILAANVDGQLAETIVQVTWQLGGQLAKRVNILAQLADFRRIIEKPIRAVFFMLLDPIQNVVDF